MGALRLFLGFVVAVGLSLSSQTFAQSPAYLYTTVGSTDYADMGPGNDMLALTDDDVELAEGGNLGGTMSQAVFDNNGNGTIDEGDRVFIQARDPDGTVATDAILFSVSSHPEYGCIYESEDWLALWEANFQGPSAVNAESVPQSRFEALLSEQSDFEINDNDGWTDQSNAYVYNNLGSNQRGLGLSKYAVEYRHPDNPSGVGAGGGAGLNGNWVLDETEGWTKTDCFVGVLDDPRTEFSERGACRRWDRTRTDLVKKGYMIPVDDLEDLQDGQLPTLFGWESVDLATYFRDTIGPLLDSPNMRLPVDGAPAEVVLPASHVMLLQTQHALNVNNDDGECGDLATIQGYGDYWGIPQDGSGEFRSSLLLAANHILTDLTFGEGAVHPWDHEAEDSQRKNLWELDHYYRGELNPEDGNYNVGDYAADGGATLLVQASSLLQIVDATNDGEMALRGPGSVTTNLSRGIGEGEYPLEVVLDLAENLSPPEDGVAAGAAALNFQIILRSGNAVVAYADISEDATQVSVGGTYDPATGRATGGEGAAGGGSELGAVDSIAAGGGFTRYILRLTAGATSLREVTTGVFETNSFLDLDTLGTQLAAAGGASGAPTQLTIATNGEAVVDTLAVFASPGTGPFSRGDCNSDFSVDLSDGVAALGYAFLGDAVPGCLAACDFNGDGLLNITNAVYFFSALFSGGPAVPGPRDAFSQRASDAALGCGNG
jgi:hypothetical protein